MLNGIFKSTALCCRYTCDCRSWAKWLYGQIKEDRNHYEKLYQQKQAEVEELKDQLNEKEIEIVKLRASEKDAFFDGKENHDDD